MVTGVVQLTHDFLGTIAYAAVSIFDNQGAADTISIVQAFPVPEGFIWVVDELHVITSDATSRTLKLSLRYVNAAGTFVVHLMSQDSGAVANRAWPLGRRFIMPPGSLLALDVPALTAGQNIRYTMSYLQMPLGQFCPKT